MSMSSLYPGEMQLRNNIYAMPMFWRDVVRKRKGSFYPKREVEGERFFCCLFCFILYCIFFFTTPRVINSLSGSLLAHMKCETEGQREEDHRALPTLLHLLEHRKCICVRDFMSNLRCYHVTSFLSLWHSGGLACVART